MRFEKVDKPLFKEINKRPKDEIDKLLNPKVGDNLAINGWSNRVKRDDKSE